MQTHEKIKTIRELKSLTQEDIANQLHISPSGYSKIERGETRVNLERLEQIADIFEMNVLELMPDSFSINNSKLENCSNFQNSFFENSQTLQHENEKLRLIIQHKNETIAQKESELATLKNIIDLLQNK